MPYSKQHKQDTRERILECARRLFNSKGYLGVTIDEIMNEARLTHGGFYRHFSGKDELYAEAVRRFLCKKSPDPWQARQATLGMGKPRARRMVVPISRAIILTTGSAAVRCSGWHLTVVGP